MVWQCPDWLSRRWRWQRWPRDAGGVTTFLAVLLGGGVLVPSAALVVDVGQLYLEREELQSGADAAAMKVAQGCAGGKCLTTTNINTLVASARDYANANAKDGHNRVSAVCGNWDGLAACSAAATNLTACIGAPPTGKYVEVRVVTETSTGSTLLPPTLARTFAGNGGDQGTAVGACARVTAAEVCTSAANATYTHTFNGPAGTATITANSALCAGQSQPFTLISYTAPNSSFAVPQFMYDYEVKSIAPGTRSVTFTVDVPACFTQVDFVWGNNPVNPLTGSVYGDTKIGSGGAPGNRSTGPNGWYNGGNRACAPKPSVSVTYAADCTATATFSNGSTANVDAAFAVTDATGATQFLRQVKGGSQNAKFARTAAATVTVEDNTFVTTTATRPRRCR